MDEAEELLIQTGARLHFGLLDTVAPFGGLGVMIAPPRNRLRFRAAESYRVDPVLADRAERIVHVFSARVGWQTLPPVEIVAEETAPVHSGYGSGTQLSLAIAEGLSLFFRRRLGPEELAQDIAGRGKRSAVGIHGYFHGGMIFEDRQNGRPGQPGVPSPLAGERLNPIQQRVEIPADWQLVLLRPAGTGPAVAGDRERRYFSQLKSGQGERRWLRRLIVDELLPAAVAGDFDRFADAVGRYNRQSGMLFADVQGGPYNGPVVTELIRCLQDRGARGIGQSSWGPGVFAWCAGRDEAVRLVDRMAGEAMDIQISGVMNSGRDVTWHSVVRGR